MVAIAYSLCMFVICQKLFFLFFSFFPALPQVGWSVECVSLRGEDPQFIGCSAPPCLSYTEPGSLRGRLYKELNLPNLRCFLSSLNWPLALGLESYKVEGGPPTTFKLVHAFGVQLRREATVKQAHGLWRSCLL